MQLIGALFTTLGGGAVGGTVGSSALTLMQGVGTVFGALTTIGSGIAANAEAKAAAKQEEFESRNEYIDGKETTAALKQELARTVANQAVAFAAGGVDLGSVSVGEAKKQAVKDTESELSIASSEALTRSMQRRRNGRNIRARGQAALFSSIFSAGQQIAGFGLDRLERGAPA